MDMTNLTLVSTPSWGARCSWAMLWFDGFDWREK